MHSARRTGSMTAVAGRGLFTATAAFALIGGGTGMAFAGEAPSSHGHESSHGEAEHGSEHQDDCEIPIVDPANEQLDATVNGATGNATARALEAGNEAVAPVHDAVCPPASEILGQLPSAGDEEEDEEATEQATSEATSEESEATSEVSEHSASSATPAPTVTDIPAMVPAAS
ncbi:hypothetical protein [Actinomycetospora callitridis]|uniref:hypothetical protein n=1 Tax=Actinomycetospora callitridis TaxID=913944 RepID=UPI0023673C7C|nr:hypothetical protein [Actinomycetospora callitridis]MDD7917718.1 hypothetical protein [Actinomycetospora callitridis]